MDRHERIARAISLSGKKKGEIAAACGVAPSAVTQWISGESKSLKPENLYALAEATGFNAEWLAIGRGAERFDANVEEAPANRGNIPLISWVQAGAFQEATEAYAPGMAEAYLPCPTPHGPWTFALKVRGQSMYNPHSPRSFHEGEMIYVDPDREAENGSFVVVKLVDEQEATFKQLVIEGSRRYLKAINPSWPEPFIEIDGEAHIVGVVIGKYSQF